MKVVVESVQNHLRLYAIRIPCTRSKRRLHGLGWTHSLADREWKISLFWLSNELYWRRESSSAVIIAFTPIALCE